MNPRSSVATTRTMASIAGTFYVAGGLAALAVVLGGGWGSAPSPGVLGPLVTAPAGPLPPRAALAGLAVTALLTGALLLDRGHRLPPRAFHAVVGAGTVLISIALLLVPTATTTLAISSLYVFILVDVVVFFSPRTAAVHTGAVVVLGALVLEPRQLGWESLATQGLAGAAVALAVARLVAIASTATLDALTGLANRRGLDTALEAAVADGARTGAPLSAALFDLDHFKVVNDAGGHAAGDEVLRRTARAARAALPAGAFLARFGGDEFAVLLPGVAGPQALEVLETLRGAGAPALSCGVAQLGPGESGADLLRRVDTALYAAKAAGRDRCRLADGDVAGLAADLAQALLRGEVRAWFQPVVETATGGFWGVEALARWHHADRGWVSPADFVPVAETTGLITGLGAAVLADACREAVSLRRRLGRDFHLTVNVSGRELTADGYPEGLLATARELGWPLALLVVEVTESLVDASTAAGLAALGTLRAAGVSVAIDDFGTGWSSFSRLDVVPADLLKLDAAFTADITTSARRRGMLTALLGLAATLDLQVVAEGVETPQQADLLRELGCPLAQGWFHGRPAPPADLCPADLAPAAPAGVACAEAVDGPYRARVGR